MFNKIEKLSMNSESFQSDGKIVGNPLGWGPVSSDLLPVLSGKRAALQDEELDRRYNLENAPDALVMIKGKEYLFFSGSTYLGHQVNPDIMAAVCESILLYGLSVARLKRHYLPTPILEVGRTAARFFGTEQAFYSSGRKEAFALLFRSVIGSFDLVFIDEFCHDFIFKEIADFCSEMIANKKRRAEKIKKVAQKKERRAKRKKTDTEGIEKATEIKSLDGKIFDGSIINPDKEINPEEEIHEKFDKGASSENLRPICSDGKRLAVRNIEKCLLHGIYTFKNRNADDLSKKLDKSYHSGDRVLIITEGIFPLEGTIAPLDDYFEILKKLGHSALLLEDSHALGVLGDRGRGTLEHFGYDTASVNRTAQDLMEYDLTEFGHEEGRPIPTEVYWTAALSKAIGGMGGIIPGSDYFINRLMEKNGVWGGESLYTPGAVAAAKGMELTWREKNLRHRLWDNALFLKKGFLDLGIKVELNGVPMVSFRYGSSATMRLIQRRLADRGILISYIPRGDGGGSQGRLRMTLSANHDRVMLERFLEVFREILTEF